MLYGTLGIAITVVLAVFSSVLTVIAYISPEIGIHSMSLLSVHPTTKPGTAQKPAVNGPTVTLGVYGSCGKADNTSQYVCVSSPYPANHSITVLQLQDGLSKILLPPHSFTVLFWIALCSWFIGILSIFISSVFSVENANVKFWANIVAHLGLLLGLGIWLAAFVFFLKSVDDFNATLKIEISQAPPLFARTGSVFILIGSAYACCVGIYIITR